MIRARLLRTAAAVILLGTVAGCAPSAPDAESEPTPEAPVVEAAIGVPIRVEQSEGVGELTLSDPSWSVDEPSGLPVPPQKGGYLVLDATWTTIEGTTSAIINYWGIVDASGTEGDPYFFVEDVFAGNDMTVGETIQGDIAFDTGPGPYVFIVYDDFINEVARFTFEAPTREGILWP